MRPRLKQEADHGSFAWLCWLCNNGTMPDAQGPESQKENWFNTWKKFANCAASANRNCVAKTNKKTANKSDKQQSNRASSGASRRGKPRPEGEVKQKRIGSPQKKEEAAKGSSPNRQHRLGSAEPSEHEIRMRAYFISERRHRLDLPGDSHADWLEAKRQLRSESVMTET